MAAQSGGDHDFAGLRSKVTFAVEGKTTGQQVEAVEAAVRRLDPTATVSANPPDSVIGVTTTASTAAVLEAIRSTGLNPAPSAARRAKRSVKDVFKLIGTALLVALFGAIFLPIITFFVAMILANLTSNCGAGSSGGCEMWAGSVAIVSIPFWAVALFALGIYAGLKSS